MNRSPSRHHFKGRHFNIQEGPDEMRATIQNKIEMKRVRNLKLQAEYKS